MRTPHEIQTHILPIRNEKNKGSSWLIKKVTAREKIYLEITSEVVF